MMRKPMRLTGGDRSRNGRARGRLSLGAALGITAALALMEAPAVRAAAPTCEEPPMASKALQEQFQDVAPGVPYQAGVPPVKDGERPKGEAAILRLAEDQMGFIRGEGRAESLHVINRLDYSGCGEIIEDGHTYEATKYSYGVSLHQNAAREDIQTDGKLRLIRVVRGNEAWDESAPGIGTHSADKLARQRELQLGRTPFGILSAIANLSPAQIRVHDTGRGAVTLQLPVDGVQTKVVLDRNYRPATVTQRVDHHLIVDEFSDYHDLNQYGLMIPRHIVETIDGHPHLALHIIQSGLATYQVFPTPAFEAPLPPPAQADNFEFGVQAHRTPVGDTPRTPDGHPDLNGFWGQPRRNGGRPGSGAGIGSDTDIVQTFPARHGIFSNFENDFFLVGQQGSNIPLYKPQEWAQVQAAQVNAPSQDPYLHCFPVTAPRVGAPVRIVRVPNDKEGEFLLFRAGSIGTPNTFQDVPVGPAFFKADEDGTWQGDPAAHWDGDTLVVETVGYNGQSWLSRAGYPVGYNLKTIERLRRQGNELFYDVTVEDPDDLQRPWVLPTQELQALPAGYSTIGTPCMWNDYPKSIGGTLG